MNKLYTLINISVKILIWGVILLVNILPMYLLAEKEYSNPSKLSIIIFVSIFYIILLIIYKRKKIDKFNKYFYSILLIYTGIIGFFYLIDYQLIFQLYGVGIYIVFYILGTAGMPILLVLGSILTIILAPIHLIIETFYTGEINSELLTDTGIGVIILFMYVIEVGLFIYLLSIILFEFKGGKENIVLESKFSKKIQCPNCSETFYIATSNVIKKGQCSHCKEIFELK